MKKLRNLLICVLSAVAVLPAHGPAHAAAADKRAPVKVDLSPREVLGVLSVVRLHGAQVGFKGEDDQDALARIGEAFDFRGIKEQARTKPSSTSEDFSAKAKTRTVARDDLERLVKWINETAIDEGTNEIVNPLKDRFQRAIDAK